MGPFGWRGEGEDPLGISRALGELLIPSRNPQQGKEQELSQGIQQVWRSAGLGSGLGTSQTGSSGPAALGHSSGGICHIPGNGLSLQLHPQKKKSSSPEPNPQTAAKLTGNGSCKIHGVSPAGSTWTGTPGAGAGP